MSCHTMTGNVDSQQYCLRWNNHRTNLLNVFDQLLQTEAFTDVTLAVNGTSIKCHKMVLAACSSYFQSLFLDNCCAHPIVVFKDIQYNEIRAILEYMYRGEVNVAQEELPSLLKVAEALRVKGLFEDDSNPSDAAGVTNSSKNPTTSNAHTTLRSTSGITVNRNIARARSTTPTPRPRQSESPVPPSSPPPAPRSPQVQVNNSENPGLMFPRHPSYLYKSPLLSPQGESGGLPLGMWPPLVMPLHLGAIENALREREQALAMANIQRMKDEKDANEIRSGNGAFESDYSRENELGRSSSSGFKRKRLSSDVDGPLLRNFLGTHMKTPDLPGLFPFRMATEGSLDERSALNFLPNVIAHAERQNTRERDEDSWNQTQEHTTSEEDASENVSDYSGQQISPSPQSEKRADLSGGRLAGYVPTQKLEWKRYKQYTTNDISAAIEAVRGGMSALQASRKFKVPSRTLYDKVKKLGIATTRPYSRVSSSTSATSIHHQSPSVLSSYAAQTAAFTSAVAAAASALSLAKQQQHQQQRERGPVIQVAGSNVEDSQEESTYGGMEESGPQGMATTPTPLNGRSNSTEDAGDSRDKSSSSPVLKGSFNLPEHAFLTVRDELNSATDPGAARTVASPMPSVPSIKN